MSYDTERTKILYSLGLKVIRFTNHEVKNHFREVCQKLNDAIITERND